MLTDQYGTSLSTNSQAARDAYVEGLDLFLSANHGAEDAFARATRADPGFCGAYLAHARALQTVGRGRPARDQLALAREHAGNATGAEAGRLGIFEHIFAGRPDDALAAIKAHRVDHPRDVLAAQPAVGVFGLIGFSGRAGREAENLAFNESLGPAFGDDWWYLTQLAFAQMESGDVATAEATIDRAMAQNPRNANGAHYKAHLHYENGEAEAGRAYLASWLPDYDKRSLLHCHISWHVALWAMYAGDTDTMWQIVDRDIAPGGAWGPPINIITDLSALLYRAGLLGVDVPDTRWQVASDYALEVFSRPGIAFVDVHAALAHAMAGRGDALAAITTGAKGDAAPTVRLLADAFAAFARGDHAAAEAEFRETLDDHERIGGSRAQRDLIEHGLCACLLRQGKAEAAEALFAGRRSRTGLVHAYGA